MKILTLSILNSVIGAGYNLILRYTKGTPIVVTMFYIHLFAALFFLSAIYYFDYKYDFKKYMSVSNVIKIALLLAFIAFIANLTGNYALINSKNPGYVKAIGSLSLAYIAIASVYLYGSHLTRETLVGILLMVIGAILIGSNMD